MVLGLLRRCDAVHQKRENNQKIVGWVLVAVAVRDTPNRTSKDASATRSPLCARPPRGGSCVFEWATCRCSFTFMTIIASDATSEIERWSSEEPANASRDSRVNHMRDDY